MINQEIKLICSDIDGTLLNKDRELAKETINQVNRIPEIPFILIGNKLDLVNQNDELYERENEQVFAKKEKTYYVETSAKTGLNIDEAFRNAGRIMKETPAGAVKLEGGRRIAETIRKITDYGLPVMDHLGLMPQSIHQYGGYSERGKTEEEASEILEDAKIIEDAGAFAVVLEKIPAKLAKEVSASISIPTIGIGAGVNCDGQILVTPDMLGLNTDFHPRFVRIYSSLAKEINKAVKAYIKDVKKGLFPSDKESY